MARRTKKSKLKTNPFWDHITENAAWYGVLAFLLAYALISFEVLDANSLVYHGLNFTAAVGILGVSLKNKTYQPAILNVVWASIALVSMVLIIMDVS